MIITKYKLKNEEAMMRKILFLFCLIALTVTVSAQNMLSIDDAFDACVAMQKSLANEDSVALKDAAQKMRKAKVAMFSSLRCKDDSVASLDGHFVFDEDFADSVALGKDVYAHSNSIARATNNRGQTSDGSILTRTCLVKAGKSTKYTFVSRGRQELGVVTEPGGKVAVRIHVTNNSGLNEWHNDNKNAKKGVSRFKTVFTLPDNRNNKVELEVINRGMKNISFVVISN